MERNLICIIGIDRFINKNLYQTQWFYNKGFRYHVFMVDSIMSLFKEDYSFTLTYLNKNYLSRILQIIRFLFLNRKRIHHLEVYTGGTFCAIYVLIGKIFRLKVLLVERGDLFHYINKWINLITRTSFFISYKLADAIWYKELYMKSALDSLKVTYKFILPNAVPYQEQVDHLKVRNIDLLWVNTLKTWRNPLWFAKSILKLNDNYSFKVAIMGFLCEDNMPTLVKDEYLVRELLKTFKNVSLIKFADPMNLYLNSRFFVLPADIVFCNYALLEAMSYGVIPIVSNVEGAGLIIKDGINGFIVYHSEDGLRYGMEKALQLDNKAWEVMSKNARMTIEREFSIDAWGERLLKEYALLLNH